MDSTRKPHDESGLSGQYLSQMGCIMGCQMQFSCVILNDSISNKWINSNQTCNRAPVSNLFPFFFLSYSLTLLCFHPACSVISPSLCLLSLYILCYAHKKVPIRSLGAWYESAFSCLVWRTFFLNCASESWESSSGLKKSDWSDNLFSWLIFCFDFNELKSNTQVPPWQKKPWSRA